jgi:hypothetical protein
VAQRSLAVAAKRSGGAAALVALPVPSVCAGLFMA